MDLDTINQHLGLPKKNIVFVNQERILKEIREVSSGRYSLKSGLFFSDAIPALNYNLSYFILRGLAQSEIEHKTFTPPTKKPSMRFHAADFLPLANLYRTQVIQLANHLDPQEFLTSKVAPTPSELQLSLKSLR